MAEEDQSSRRSSARNNAAKSTQRSEATGMPAPSAQSSPNKGASDFDVFYEEVVFPDPEAVFTFHPKSIDEIAGDAIVVLDTNVLLTPYRADVKVDQRGDIARILEELKASQRLIIPAQAAREFAVHRAKQVADAYAAISKRMDTLPTPGGAVLRYWEDVDAYNEMLQAEQEVREKLRLYKTSIEKMLTYLKNWHGNDPISILYSRLFSEGIVYEPSIDQEVLKTDLSWRGQHKIPPGWKDGIREVGDLLIWKTMLDIASKRKQNMLFVSGDQKADWRVRTTKSNDQENNNIALYPRYELTEEYRRSSAGHTLHILQFSEFLQLFGASEEIVGEVRSLEKEDERIVIKNSTVVEQPSFLSAVNSVSLSLEARKLSDRIRSLIDEEDIMRSEELKRYEQSLIGVKSETTRKTRYDAYLQRLNQVQRTIQTKYNRQYKVLAMITRDRVLQLIPYARESRGDVDRWYENGAGGNILEMVAADLERLAFLLVSPDARGYQNDRL